MAFASSRIGAQKAIIKPCDLCEEEENVNAFCKDCVQHLCDRCKKGHLRNNTCKNHRLVSVLEGIAITKKHASNLCQDHEEPVSFFCRSCEKNICSKCFSMIHKKHNCVEIHEMQSHLQTKLDDILKEKNNEKERITKNLEALVAYENECENTVKQSDAFIDDRVKAIQLATAEEGIKLKKSIKTTADQRLKEAKESKRKLETMKNVYDEEIQAVKQELTFQTASTLNQFVKASDSKLHSLKPESFSIPMCLTFTAGSINTDFIRDMIGKDGSTVKEQRGSETVEEGGNSILSKLSIENIHNLRVNKKCKTICASPDGSIWIGGDGFVYNMRSDCSSVLHQIPTRKFLFSSFACYDIACLKSGDAVVSYGDGYSFVDRFTSEGSRVVFADLSNWCTHGICVNKNDEVIVGVASFVLSPVSSLIIFSREGNKLQEIQMDTEKECFSTDRNQCFITSDSQSLYLTILNRRGAVLEKIQTTKSNIWRMTCDNHGNALAVCREGKDVHLISNHGKCERSYTIECDKKINGICIDRENKLLILVDFKKVIVTKYRI